MPEFQTFDEFYAVYLTAHRNRWNRLVHLLGWLIGAGIAVGALLSGNPWWLLASVGVGVGLLAIAIGHRLIEPTHAVEFKYPLRTALANLRMFADMARGRFKE